MFFTRFEFKQKSILDRFIYSNHFHILHSFGVEKYHWLTKSTFECKLLVPKQGQWRPGRQRSSATDRSCPYPCVIRLRVVGQPALEPVMANRACKWRYACRRKTWKKKYTRNERRRWKVLSKLYINHEIIKVKKLKKQTLKNSNQLISLVNIFFTQSLQNLILSKDLILSKEDQNLKNQLKIKINLK